MEYMYLDSTVGSWQMSTFLVNSTQGAIGSTLSQLYMGHAYQVSHLKSHVKYNILDTLSPQKTQYTSSLTFHHLP